MSDLTTAETTVKTDTAKVESTIKSDFNTYLVGAENEIKAVEAKTYSFTALAITAAVAFILGFIAKAAL